MNSLEGLKCGGEGATDCPLTMVLKALRADLYPLTGTHFLRSAVSMKPLAFWYSVQKILLGAKRIRHTVGWTHGRGAHLSDPWRGSMSLRCRPDRSSGQLSGWARPG